MEIIYCNHELIKRHLAEALVMAGLAKDTRVDHIKGDIKELTEHLVGPGKLTEVGKSHFDRGPKLGGAKPASGHDCYLKGVIVTAVISMPAYQWQQFQRYHFADIITSQSKMHKLTEMDLRKQTNIEVEDELIERLNTLIGRYNRTQEDIKKVNDQFSAEEFLEKFGYSKEKELKSLKHNREKLFRTILNNCPHGLHLAAGIYTNYLQLKNMFYQRSGHRLTEWNTKFTDWVLGLPYFEYLTGVTEIN